MVVNGGSMDVINPLYEASSPSRDMNHTAGDQQQGGKKPAGRSQAPGRGTTTCRTCCSSTPWIVVFAIALLIAAQVAWAVYTDRFMSAGTALLDKLHTKPPADLHRLLVIVKAVLLSVTSFLGLVLLILGIMVKRQRLSKRAASSRAEWPHGCGSVTTVVLSVFLSMMLWAIAAGFVVLLCCTFTATGASLAGDLAAGQALNLVVNRGAEAAARMQQLEASMAKAASAFTSATEKAPPFIKRSPWFKLLDDTVSPHLQAANSTRGATPAQVDSLSCPITCLDLRIVAALLPDSSNGTAVTCLCLQEAIREVQSLLSTMWKSGVAAMAAVATLAVLATWLLVYCLVNCIITWRDHKEAQHCRQQSLSAEAHAQAAAGDAGGKWGWAAATGAHAGGPASPGAASGHSSFPAFDLPAARGAAGSVPSTGSPSPAKVGSKGWQRAGAAGDQYAGGAARGGAGAHSQADDIERPAQTQPDQAAYWALSPPQLPATAAPRSSDQRQQQVQLPAGTPMGSKSGAGRDGGGATGAARQQSMGGRSSNAGTNRPRWQP